MSAEIKFYCSECGSENVQVRAWVYANTFEFVNTIDTDREGWCDECKDHRMIITDEQDES